MNPFIIGAALAGLILSRGRKQQQQQAVPMFAVEGKPNPSSLFNSTQWALLGVKATVEEATRLLADAEGWPNFTQYVTDTRIRHLDVPPVLLWCVTVQPHDAVAPASSVVPPTFIAVFARDQATAQKAYEQLRPQVPQTWTMVIQRGWVPKDVAATIGA